MTFCCRLVSRKKSGPVAPPLFRSLPTWLLCAGPAIDKFLFLYNYTSRRTRQRKHQQTKKKKRRDFGKTPGGNETVLLRSTVIYSPLPKKKTRLPCLSPFTWHFFKQTTHKTTLVITKEQRKISTFEKWWWGGITSKKPKQNNNNTKADISDPVRNKPIRRQPSILFLFK